VHVTASEGTNRTHVIRAFKADHHAVCGNNMNNNNNNNNNKRKKARKKEEKLVGKKIIDDGSRTKYTVAHLMRARA
jgi:hypothetical protein